MRPSRATWWILGAWLLLVGGYALVALVVPRGPRLTAFGDIMQCLVPLFANAGLLLNAGSPNWRRNAFWMLMALGCTFWMLGQLLWTYFEIYLHQAAPNPFIGDVIFFLHIVPMIAALALRPHRADGDETMKFGHLDFSLLLVWWVYLYLFVVIPWQFLLPNDATYLHNYIQLNTVENLVLIAGLGALCLSTTGFWRARYAHLFGASALYAFSSQAANVAIAQDKYYTGSLYDVPLVASFVWFGTAGILAYRAQPPEEAPDSAARPVLGRFSGTWTAWLATAAVLSLPSLALWVELSSATPPQVRRFRLITTLGAIVVLSFLVFLRQHLLGRERLRLLRASEDSVDNMRRLQSHFVQAEKLASLGQLAAGAAHEINNPLTAILGYSDMIIDDLSAGDRPRSIAEKIREQARRTKTLVTHLLSFARQVPPVRSLLDINAILSSAVQLRALDLHGKHIEIEISTESVLPAVRGDQNQFLQIFLNIINNAVDALEEVGGGKLIIRTRRDHSLVIVEFSDTGPGLQNPQMVFDPFYTTKPVGKGTGLGLSICYGLVQEHGGTIEGFNRPDGGATFRIALPAILALVPSTAREPVASSSTPVPSSAPKQSAD